MTIGESIKEYRKKKGLTQKELAEKVGVATGTIQQYELNKRSPRPDIMETISRVIDLPYREYEIGNKHIFLPEKIVDLFAGTNTTKEFIRYAMTAMQDRAKELDRLGFDMEDLDALSYFRPLNPTNREKSIDYMKLLKLSQDNEDSPPDPDQHDHQ